MLLFSSFSSERYVHGKERLSEKENSSEAPGNLSFIETSLYSYIYMYIIIIYIYINLYIFFSAKNASLNCFVLFSF